MADKKDNSDPRTNMPGIEDGIGLHWLRSVMDELMSHPGHEPAGSMGSEALSLSSGERDLPAPLHMRFPIGSPAFATVIPGFERPTNGEGSRDEPIVGNAAFFAATRGKLDVTHIEFPIGRHPRPASIIPDVGMPTNGEEYEYEHSPQGNGDPKGPQLLGPGDK